MHQKRRSKPRKHNTPTPGPWHANHCHVRTEDGRQVAMVNGYIADSGDTEVCFANARLIAAAPALLDACKEAAEFIKNGTPIYPGSFVAQAIVDAVSAVAGVHAEAEEPIDHARIQSRLADLLK